MSARSSRRQARRLCDYRLPTGELVLSRTAHEGDWRTVGRKGFEMLAVWTTFLSLWLALWLLYP